MRQRPARRLEPGVDRLEGKCLLSGAAPLAHAESVPMLVGTEQARPRLTLERITNPNPINATLNPPFDQIFVQARKPVKGGMYNVLSVSVRNTTPQTFDANSGFRVRLTDQTRTFPVLTGTETWRPREVKVFYVLTKKYYPISNVTGGGFQFDFGGTSSGIAIPGPSGIFQRIRYNPATFPRLLNYVVAHGIGSKGHELGLPDTAIWEFIPARIYVVPL